jgi:cbb3-type cytochrome oxidase subunit 3
MVIYLIKKGKHHWDDAARLPLDDDKMNYNQSEQ